jgi:hypothetical protein
LKNIFCTLDVKNSKSEKNVLNLEKLAEDKIDELEFELNHIAIITFELLAIEHKLFILETLNVWSFDLPQIVAEKSCRTKVDHIKKI